jgi:hypothetical protein
VANCEPLVIERTILVPQTIMERRTIAVTEYRCEPRDEVVTVTRMVQEPRSYTRTVTYMTREERTRVEPCTIVKPVCREQTFETIVNVPRVEKREGVRMVTQYVSVKEERVVREDHGHFEERVITVPYCETGCQPSCRGRGLFRRRGGACCEIGGGCDIVCGGDLQVAGKMADACQYVQKVWVPNIVERKVEVVVQRPQCVEERYQYDVEVCRPEKQLQKRMVTEYIEVPADRIITYYECVPKTREVVCHETVCKPVTEQRTITRMVQVAYAVKKEIMVPVCRMVEKKVLCTVYPSCGPGCGFCR